jgi:hypothetical protein
MHSSPTASLHHDSQGHESDTAMLPSHQDDASETSTIIASDDDMGLSTYDHQQNEISSSPSSPSSPSASIQYNSPNAGTEGNAG